MHLYCMLEMTSRDFPGLRFDYLYPYGVAAAAVSRDPGDGARRCARSRPESAARGSLVEALEYE